MNVQLSLKGDFRVIHNEGWLKNAACRPVPGVLLLLDPLAYGLELPVILVTDLGVQPHVEPQLPQEGE
jgi:hypothetical protein